MIDQLKQITHVNGYIVQPSKLTDLAGVSDWEPVALEIGVDGNAIHIRAETQSADALVASVRAVLDADYDISEPMEVIDDCVTLEATPKRQTTKPIIEDSDDATAD